MLNLDSKLSTVGYYRGKYMEGYASDAMEGALLAVAEGMTIRKAEAYGVPKSTLGDRVSGKVDRTAKPKRTSFFPKNSKSSVGTCPGNSL